MKKRAILYIRVSTDEQAERGYSLLEQKDRLIKYCEQRDIEAVALYKEDHSAKSFDRPEWKKLLEFVKSNKGGINSIYIVDWSRFSRNTSDAYMMIEKLKHLGIEVQAIDQPLDLSIPENQMMLAIYLTQPQIENMRRSIRVKSGMKRARLEGRVMGIAPKGFKNCRDEKGNAYITASEHAELMKEAFLFLEKGLYTQEEIRKELNKKGLKIGRSNFNSLIRNPVYCGNIEIRDEHGDKQLVKGLHEPLITEQTFYNVQKIIDGKRMLPVKYSSLMEELPLRGFLKCPRCAGNLTGSATTAKGKKFYYYHCRKGCPTRNKAQEVNDSFLHKLQEIRTKSEVLDLYYETVKGIFKDKQKQNSSAIKKFDEEISKNQERINNAQQLMLDSKLDPSDYREIKERYDKINATFKVEKSNIETVDSNYMKYMEYNIHLLKNIDKAYQNASVDIKSKIIVSIFPEKLTYENKECRNGKVNSVVSLILDKNSTFGPSKGGGRNRNIPPSAQVILSGVEG